MLTSSFTLDIIYPSAAREELGVLRCLLGYRSANRLVFRTPRFIVFIETTCLQVKRYVRCIRRS